MDVQNSRPKQDRPIFLDLLLIAAVMAFLMWGGLRLLGRTHVAWDDRNTERATRTEAIQQAAARGRADYERAEADHRQAAALQQLEQIRRARAEMEQREARMRNRRCLHGILFAEIDGVLTNIGRC
jgi:hypothetical protein